MTLDNAFKKDALTMDKNGHSEQKANSLVFSFFQRRTQLIMEGVFSHTHMPRHIKNAYCLKHETRV